MSPPAMQFHGAPPPSTSRTARRHLVALAPALLAVASPTVAYGGADRGLEEGVRKKVTIVSVDGPRDLTIRQGSRTYRVRLDNIDVPLGASAGRAPQCGADLAVAALRRLTPRGRRVTVFPYGLRESGRALVDIQVPPHVDPLDDWVSDQLVGRGVARPGIGQAVGARSTPNTDLLDLEYFPGAGESYYTRGDPVNLARAHVGIWGACHGRFHLAGGTKPPPVRPAVWTVSPAGQATAVGKLALLPSPERPSEKTTFGDAAGAFPDLEIVRSYTGRCVGVSGRGAVRFQGADTDRHRQPCASEAIRSVTSLDRSRTTAGPAVGDRTATLAARYPASTIDRPFVRYAELDGQDLDGDSAKGDQSPKTLWRAAALLRKGRITGWFARLPRPR